MTVAILANRIWQVASTVRTVPVTVAPLTTNVIVPHSPGQGRRDR